MECVLVISSPEKENIYLWVIFEIHVIDYR